MQRAKNKIPRCWKNARAAFGLLLLLLMGSQIAAYAQSASAAASEQELTVSDLLKLPGTIIGEGSNTRAVGKFRVASYRVEQVTLPQARTVEIGGQRTEVTHAFRVTIVGGPFPVRALPPVVWIGDVALGYGVENEDLTEITVVTFDRAAIHEGLSLYLSYGDKQNKDARAELPEKLFLNGAKGGRQ
jgi:hypothetical protein